MFGRKAKIVYSIILILLMLFWEYTHFYYIYNEGNSAFNLGFDFYSIFHLFPILGLLGFIFLPKYVKFKYPLILFLLINIIHYSPLHKSCNTYPGFFSVGGERCECVGTVSKFERVTALDAGHVDYCIGIVKKEYEVNFDTSKD